MPEPPSPETIAQLHRWFAIECNNGCWDLISQPQRTKDEGRLMLQLAYAAGYHWSQAGTALNGARADLTIAWVHSLLGNGALAGESARRCLDYFEHNPGEDWDLAFAQAAMAFAAAVEGDANQQARFYAEAKHLGEAIQDEVDRKIFFESFNQVPNQVHK
jgi:hypothetical protein